MSDTRIVLVKPGDILIFGNLGSQDHESWETAASVMSGLKELCGLAHILIFENDIDLAVLPGEANRRNTT